MPLLDTRIIGDRAAIVIRIYPTTVLVSRQVGPVRRTYPIAPDALAATLGKLPRASGLLAPHTLATGTDDGTPWYIVWSPGQIIDLQIADQATPLRVPIPPLVWHGSARAYRVAALATPDYPTATSVLMRAPFPNVYAEGGVCWGNVREVVAATPATMLPMRRLFLEQSAFNQHGADGKSIAYPRSVLAHYAALAAASATVYPLDDLLPLGGTLASWIGGAA